MTEQPIQAHISLNYHIILALLFLSHGELWLQWIQAEWTFKFPWGGTRKEAHYFQWTLTWEGEAYAAILASGWKFLSKKGQKWSQEVGGETLSTDDIW